MMQLAMQVLSTSNKKNNAFVTNGSLSSTYRNAIKLIHLQIYGSDINFNINNYNKKWNFYSNANASKNNNFSNLFLERTTSADVLQSAFDQNFQKIFTGSILAGKLGMDYYVSEKTTIGIILDRSTSTRKLDNFSQTFIAEIQFGVINNNSLI